MSEPSDEKERDPLIDEKERDRKRRVDAKFGPGYIILTDSRAYEAAKKKLKPHRCKPELTVFFKDLADFKGLDSFQNFLSCLWNDPK